MTQRGGSRQDPRPVGVVPHTLAGTRQVAPGVGSLNEPEHTPCAWRPVEERVTLAFTGLVIGSVH